MTDSSGIAAFDHSIMNALPRLKFKPFPKAISENTLEATTHFFLDLHNHTIGQIVDLVSFEEAP
jgi:hypothetical protein